MSDPIPTDDVSLGATVSSGQERSSKIEQLLLAGLEHYFAGRYDDAINVWTRALFLDRSHPRARAYIDRARAALSERQRASEELLHQGLQAFARHDASEARRLLHDAMAKGAPADQALAALERLDRIGAADHSPVPQARVSGLQWQVADQPTGVRASGWSYAALVGLLAVIVSSVAIASGVLRPSIRPFASRSTIVAPPASRPIVAPPLRASDATISRARALVQSGRLKEALWLLETVRSSDEARPEADALRIDIQQQLLRLTVDIAPDGPPPSIVAPAERPQ